MADAVHLRAAEIYSAVLERIAVDWDGGLLPGSKSGEGGLKPRTKRLRDEGLKDQGAKRRKNQRTEESAQARLFVWAGAKLFALGLQFALGAG